MITKRDFILRGSCFCEKHSMVQSNVFTMTVYHFYNEKGTKMVRIGPPKKDRKQSIKSKNKHNAELQWTAACNT